MGALPSPPRPLDALVAELLGRAQLGAKLGLERVRETLAALGDPQQRLTVVHVAGTNGKGSTCALVEAIARAAGRRTGLYTSPHLVRLNERIRIDGRPIDDASFRAALAAALRADLPPLSFFEVLTVAALVAMDRAGIEIAILEVGLGGRLDATNVVERPACTAITSIGRDHTRYLGDTLAAIAREKAGIAKRGAPLVLGPVGEEASAAVRAVAAEAGAGPLWQLRRSGSPASPPGVAAIELCEKEARFPDGSRIELGAVRLEGMHQIDNAAVAAAVARLVLGGAEARGAIARGLEQVTWPGRLERFEQDGVAVVLDAAHNLEAALALGRSLEHLAPERTLLLFGAMEDKPWRAMLHELGPRARERVYTAPLERLVARGPAPLAELASVAPGVTIADPLEAFRHVVSRARPGDTVLVTGSIFLVGAARALLTGASRDVAIPL